jgi:hypothetical protein
MDVISGRKLETFSKCSNSCCKKFKYFCLKNCYFDVHEGIFRTRNFFLCWPLGLPVWILNTDPNPRTRLNLGSENANLADQISHFTIIFNKEKSKEQTNIYGTVQHVSKISRLWYFLFACPAGGGPRLGVLSSEILQHRPVHHFLPVGIKPGFLYQDFEIAFIGFGFRLLSESRISDPHNHFNADPDSDPSFHFNADPDLTHHINAAPNPALHKIDDSTAPF